MMLQAKGVPDSNSHAVPPSIPHSPQRRPRVREVSSRFMSSEAFTYSCGHAAKSPLLQQQQSISALRQRRYLETEAYENRPAPSKTPRSLGTSFNSYANIQNKNPHFTDCGNLQGISTSTPLKPESPMLTIIGVSLSSTFNASSSSQEISSVSAHGIGGTADSLLDFRSTEREADLLPSVATRLLTDRNVNDGDSSKLYASPLVRSLNSLLSTCEANLSHRPNPPPIKGVSTKMAPLPLPRVPSHTKPDAKRRPKKVSGHQEDLQSLKLLHNYYLQWRYANAKAEASMQIQTRETERTLYSLDMKILDLYDWVRRKRIEIQLLRRMKTLLKILEDQMPYLEAWSAIQGDYSNSLSEVIQSLLNTSLLLPISANVEADTTKVRDAIRSAITLMEMILCHVQSFMPKAEEMESLISELARVAARERALVEECGDLLSNTKTFQVEECSLRGFSEMLRDQLPSNLRGHIDLSNINFRGEWTGSGSNLPFIDPDSIMGHPKPGQAWSIGPSIYIHTHWNSGIWILEIRRKRRETKQQSAIAAKHRNQKSPKSEMDASAAVGVGICPSTSRPFRMGFSTIPIRLRWRRCLTIETEAELAASEAQSVSRRLILLRHAKSSWQHPALKDHDRPLSKTGQADAVLVSKKLQHMGWIPQLILSSDALRTRETLSIMQDKVRGFLEAEVHFISSFYSIAAMDGQTAEHLQRTICQYSRDEVLTIMCMGHNRGWEEAASMFTGASIELKTCNAALLEAKGTSWEEAFAVAGFGGWKLQGIVTPSSNL
ncbi:hypothetical protein COLO4_31969 [Corchorus olitorius]|uniref:Histidine phosphatase superfamily, clade-1 n=1 Tax=Corchorus olitorius TaxID=93759 RepID=A0A1R3H2S6_9ROSI|nr:hypothetical protein COLO4_31969 [Corchorus olitorius]